MIWSFPHESLAKRGEGSRGCREGTSKLPWSGHWADSSTATNREHMCAVNSIVSGYFQQRTYVFSEFHCLSIHVQWVPLSQHVSSREHTCAVNSIVSGCFLLGTCPRRPQLHGRGHPISYGTCVNAIGHLGQPVLKERGWIPFLPSQIVPPAQHRNRHPMPALAEG